MKTIRTSMAVVLMGLALTAFQSDALAQARRGGTGSSRSTSRSASPSRTTSSSNSSRSNVSSSRSSGVKSASRSTVSPSTDRKPGRTSGRQPSTTVSKPSATTSGTVNRQTSGTVNRQTSGTVNRQPSGTVNRQTSGTVSRPTTVTPSRPAGSTVSTPATQAERPQTRPATRPGKQSPAVKPDSRPDNKPISVTRPGHRPGDKKPGGVNVRPDRPQQIRPDHKPDVHRVHPRDRDFMHYSKPSYYWTGHNHCYGHRVRVLPTHVHRHVHYGVTYYCYNDIWYRPYGGYYVVCRPPFGTVLAANLVADMTWAAIRFSYYNTVYQTYSQINENNAYIAQQNQVIAQNNATIAAQNAQIAAGQQQAQLAYSLANQLGLIQSYAAAGSTYYYQDGVFYSMDASGQYSVIVPPAGALVETLPEDYDMVTLADGNEYYKVDDTVYRITISEGKPYFEVLGQLYS
ncbi:MAG: hypothetical protein E7115_08950 [Bacteroidales bacterium]|nr:hypothetical protein [Bacteroidales bacterium]